MNKEMNIKDRDSKGTEEIVKQLIDYAGKDNVEEYADMKRHITFKAGGKARVLVNITEAERLAELVRYLNKEEVPYYVLGNGSNVLFKDEGYEGVVLKIGRDMGYIEIKDNIVTAGAGAMLTRVSSEAQKNSLTGLEFACGIPGYIGGAVTMNAGAYGGEMKDVIKTVTLMDKVGNIMKLSGDKMDFSYRHSKVQDEELIVLEAVMELEKGNKDEIRSKMDELLSARKEKQPLEYPSAGSTFKRPEGYFAGKLIQDAGLKGYRVGGAMVSEKHSGFVINYDNASAKDILDVIADVKRIVKEKFDVELEPEVKIIE